MDRRSSSDFLGDGDVADADNIDICSIPSSLPASLPPLVTPPEDPVVNQILSTLLTEPYLSIPEPKPDDKLDSLLDPFRKHFGNVTADAKPEKRPYRLWTHENKFRFLRETLRHFPSHADVAVEICRDHPAHINRLIDALAMRYIYPFSKRFRVANGVPRSLLIAVPNVLIEAPNPLTNPSTEGPNKPATRKRSAEDADSPASRRSRSTSTAEETFANLKDPPTTALLERDRRCLFCWEPTVLRLQGCRIVGADSKASVFFRNLGTSFGFGNDVYNGSNALLLCAVCHIDFDALQTYVEERCDENGRFAGHHVRFLFDEEGQTEEVTVRRSLQAKFAARKNAEEPKSEGVLISGQQRPFQPDAERKMRGLVRRRKGEAEEAVMAAKNGAPEPKFEDVLIDDQLRLFHFGNSLGHDTNLPLPNRFSLDYHKRCCLIWKLSGGPEDMAKDEDDESSDGGEAYRREPLRVYDQAKRKGVAAWCSQVVEGMMRYLRVVRLLPRSSFLNSTVNADTAARSRASVLAASRDTVLILPITTTSMTTAATLTSIPRYLMAGVPTSRLGRNGPLVPALGLGIMGMSGFYGPSNEAQNLATLNHALDIGCTFIDTADMYGVGANEKLLGKVLATRRDEVFLCTKFGVRRGPNGEILGISGKPEYDTVRAMSELVKEGRVGYLGLSKASAATIRRAHAVHPITAYQVEFSPWWLDIETNDILKTCRELGIAIVAYSPLGRGFLSGDLKHPDQLDATDRRRDFPRFQGDAFRQNLEIVDALRELAAAKNVTVAQMTLAWVLAQGDDVVAIPGTRRAGSAGFGDWGGGGEEGEGGYPVTHTTTAKNIYLMDSLASFFATVEMDREVEVMSLGDDSSLASADALASNEPSTEASVKSGQQTIPIAEPPLADFVCFDLATADVAVRFKKDGPMFPFHRHVLVQNDVISEVLNDMPVMPKYRLLDREVPLLELMLPAPEVGSQCLEFLYEKTPPSVTGNTFLTDLFPLLYQNAVHLKLGKLLAMLQKE
ncbi:hypothetical protein HDU96_001155 [Phlyctochytrium bullatum]|nr:hypothetical protein HDU96_001155 [Phlyctochytrium bullatum]